MTPASHAFSQHAGPDLPAVFLGLPARTSDDRALLGLEGEGLLGRDRVLSALKDRLQRVSQHSLAATPEAAEMRMMLHAAVARVLMAQPARPGESVLSAPSSKNDSVRDFEDLATLTLAKHGGWNPSAAQELHMLAAAMGVPQERVPSVLTNLANLGSPSAGVVMDAPGRHPTAQAAVVRQAAAVASRPARLNEATTPEQQARVQAALDEFEAYRSHEDPARRMVRNGLIGAGVGLLFLVVGAIGLRIMFAGKPAGTGAPATTSATPELATPGSVPNATVGIDATAAGSSERLVVTPAPPPGSADVSPPMASRPDVEVTVGEALAQLRSAAADVARDPGGSGERVAFALERMGLLWSQDSESGVVAAGDASAEFAYRAGGIVGPDREAALEPMVSYLERAISQMADGSAPWTPERIRGASFACGITARLLAERDLPSALRVRLRRQLSVALGGSLPSDQATVRQSVSAALDRMSAKMVSSAAGASAAAPVALSQQATAHAWGAWGECAKTLLAEHSEREYAQLLLLALDRALTAPAEPSHDPLVASGIDQLTRRLPLGPDSPAKRAILGWLVRTDVSSLDLHVLTGALVQAPDSGLELTATLSASATPTDREHLRERYANLWQVTDEGGTGVLAQRWLQEARSILAAQPGPSLRERLALAVRFSALNTAAVETQRGDAISFGLLMQTASTGFERAQNPSPLRLGAFASSWGPQYVGAGNDIVKRRELLQVVRQGLSPLEARIVVEEAMRAGSPEVRRDARTVLQRTIEEPDLIKALLDFQPFIPATRDNSKLLELATGASLPSLRSPTWRVEVRRALLRKLLEMLTPADLSYVDVAADFLLTDYRTRIKTDPNQPDADPEDAMGQESATQQVPASSPDRAAGLPQLRSVPEQLLAAARTYQAQWIALAQRGWLADPAFMSVADVMRVRDARLAACETDLQRFVVEQNAIIELQARVVVTDNRASKDQARLVVEAWRRDASAALHVFDQIAAGELAQARLWALRLGGSLDVQGSPTPGGVLVEPGTLPPSGAATSTGGSAGS